MSNETELKPCAHCGKNKWLITSAMDEVWAYCNEKTNGCGLVIHSKHNTKASVIEAINTRPIEDTLNAENRLLYEGFNGVMQQLVEANAEIERLMGKINYLFRNCSQPKGDTK